MTFILLPTALSTRMPARFLLRKTVTSQTKGAQKKNVSMKSPPPSLSHCCGTQLKYQWGSSAPLIVLYKKVDFAKHLLKIWGDADMMSHKGILYNGASVRRLYEDVGKVNKTVDIKSTVQDPSMKCFRVISDFKTSCCKRREVCVGNCL